jgi:hypothetical protein
MSMGVGAKSKQAHGNTSRLGLPDLLYNSTQVPLQTVFVLELYNKRWLVMSSVRWQSHSIKALLQILVMEYQSHHDGPCQSHESAGRLHITGPSLGLTVRISS